jgi:hypothetical protein
MTQRPGIPLAAATAALLLAATAPARADLFATDKFTLYGDARVRAESDWNSQDPNGVARDDRLRLRARLRVGFRFDPNKHWQVGARVRSGAEENQQSPHITLVDLDGNDTGDASFNFDRWYLLGRIQGVEALAGRNNMPFWKQDDMLFDDDVTMIGITVRWREESVGPGALSVVGGLFSPPVGMRATVGTAAAGQVAWHPELARVQWTFAAGLFDFSGDPDDPDAAGLLDGNGTRDYKLFQGCVQARFEAGGRPLVLGGDLLYNLEDYEDDDTDPFTAENFDQVDGYVLLATWGSLDGRGWQVGWTHARIETFAVHNSYAQDDWVRWGSASQTRASNMKGDEVRFGWAFDPQMNILARLYIAEAITTVEDGMRFRVDFNYTF